MASGGHRRQFTLNSAVEVMYVYVHFHPLPWLAPHVCKVERRPNFVVYGLSQFGEHRISSGFGQRIFDFLLFGARLAATVVVCAFGPQLPCLLTVNRPVIAIHRNYSHCCSLGTIVIRSTLSRHKTSRNAAKSLSGVKGDSHTVTPYFELSLYQGNCKET